MFSEPCYTATGGGKGFWGGYTWNTTLFKDPHAFVAKLNTLRGPLGIKVAVNTHPDRGIDACQLNYHAMAEAIGFDTGPAGNATITDLNQACGTEAKDKSMTCSREYVEAYFKYMINPTSVSGASVAADYSWTDSPDVTTFTNELYVRYPGTKRKKRSINFSRYGGMGQHRTPIGFSGDTLRQWDTLTYQTYFTPRAANVAFGWWSHDIGGFSGSPVDDVFHTEGPELYLRWLQFGCYAPVFRTHCRYCEQRPWTFGDDWFSLMRRPMVARSNLVPYIYTHAAMRSYGSGEALLTPTYWDPAAAGEAEAYAPEYGRQYFFGRELLVAPVTEPLSHDPGQPKNNDTTWDAANKGTVPRSVWLPPGEWLAWTSASAKPSAPDAHSGVGAAAVTAAAPPPPAILRGPTVDTRHYGLDEIPVYVRAGAVIPTRTMASAYHTIADPLVWMVAVAGSGEANGEGLVYEDDGESLAFSEGVAAVTTLTYTTTTTTELHVQAEGGQDAAAVSKVLDVMVSAPNGTFTGMASERAQWVVLYGETTAPATASCDGKSLSQTAVGVVPGWWIAEKSGTDSVGGAEMGGENELMIELPSLVLACGKVPTTAPRALKVSW
jgi:alpha-glucosidase (family GH31 glycosyl hydrolase)